MFMKYPQQLTNHLIEWYGFLGWLFLSPIGSLIVVIRLVAVVRCLPPKTRARGSARRQVRHKAPVEPLPRRLGQYAAIAALHQVVCSKRSSKRDPDGTEAGDVRALRAVPLFTPESQVRSDSPLEGTGFEPVWGFPVK
jgi:hypothetical protein